MEKLTLYIVYSTAIIIILIYLNKYVLKWL